MPSSVRWHRLAGLHSETHQPLHERTVRPFMVADAPYDRGKGRSRASSATCSTAEGKSPRPRPTETATVTDANTGGPSAGQRKASGRRSVGRACQASSLSITLTESRPFRLIMAERRGGTPGKAESAFSNPWPRSVKAEMQLGEGGGAEVCHQTSM